ncbi:hypothetical protein FHW67_001163 [Herbaspirillum sp. Sphag1AN]|uniref:DUF4148 domain-containing protein n=1 Tax=unclassified Herbaspirillum TaxID=2624150 RepID=UPI001608AB0C|nr:MULTISPECIES: DUF4148 domain-containing protein [unclassified Herbaspirillum]MBB3211895.1 hypothetical protein [Herbaspirillum sp. Sphag1AN]MBB3244271.1 hypothetical protein [Herbaspirillum sp. Sphag64]
MNTKQITAAVVLFAAAGAALAEAPYPPETKFVSTKTRAEVLAELKQAQAQGLITNGNNYPITVQPRSTLTRSQVISQLKPAATDSTYSGA